MGVAIERPADGEVVVHGVGLHGLKAPAGPLDLGNAGTGMRLLAGLMAGQFFDSELTGDASLCSRPMGRVIDPLRLMGADIGSQEGGRPPLRVHGAQPSAGVFTTTCRWPAPRSSPVCCWRGLYSPGPHLGDRTGPDPRPHRAHAARLRLPGRAGQRGDQPAGRGQPQRL